MNAKAIRAIAAFAALRPPACAPTSRRSQVAVKFEGTRTRTEVKAEAARSSTRSS